MLVQEHPLQYGSDQINMVSLTCLKLTLNRTILRPEPRNRLLFRASPEPLIGRVRENTLNNPRCHITPPSCNHLYIIHLIYGRHSVYRITKPLLKVAISSEK